MKRQMIENGRAEREREPGEREQERERAGEREMMNTAMNTNPPA